MYSYVSCPTEKYGIVHAKAAEGWFGIGAKLQGVWETGVQQRGPGRSPGRGLVDKVPQKLKNF